MFCISARWRKARRTGCVASRIRLVLHIAFRHAASTWCVWYGERKCPAALLKRQQYIKPGVGYNTTARLGIIAVWRFLPCISEGSIAISWKQQQLLSICRTVRYSRVRSVWMSYRRYRSVRYRYESLYRYRRYRYGCRTELTEVSGTGIYIVPNLPKCPVPVSISYRTYRSVRYRY